MSASLFPVNLPARASLVGKNDLGPRRIASTRVAAAWGVPHALVLDEINLLVAGDGPSGGCSDAFTRQHYWLTRSLAATGAPHYQVFMTPSGLDMLFMSWSRPVASDQKFPMFMAAKTLQQAVACQGGRP